MQCNKPTTSTFVNYAIYFIIIISSFNSFMKKKQKSMNPPTQVRSDQARPLLKATQSNPDPNHTKIKIIIVMENSITYLWIWDKAVGFLFLVIVTVLKRRECRKRSKWRLVIRTFFPFKFRLFNLLTNGSAWI